VDSLFRCDRFFAACRSDLNVLSREAPGDRHDSTRSTLDFVDSEYGGSPPARLLLHFAVQFHTRDKSGSRHSCLAPVIAQTRFKRRCILWVMARLPSACIDPIRYQILCWSRHTQGLGTPTCIVQINENTPLARGRPPVQSESRQGLASIERFMSDCDNRP
jgi:hypothetical protein